MRQFMNILIKPILPIILILATPTANAVAEYTKILPHASAYTVHIVPNIRTATVRFKNSRVRAGRFVWFKFACNSRDKPVEVIRVESKKNGSPSLINTARHILKLPKFSGKIAALCTS